MTEPQTTPLEEQMQQIAASEGLATNSEGELVLAGFTLSPTALIPDGSPSFEDWDRVGHILRYFHTGMQFWLGDWMNYGEQSYGEKYSQALKDTDYELKTLQTYAWVANKVKPAQRVEAIPFGYYVNGLAALDEGDQKRWVDRILAGEDGDIMSRQEFQKALRAEKRSKNIAQELPDGKFRVIYVDFPWKYREEGVQSEDGESESFTKAESHYPTMSLDDILDFAERIKERTMHDAVMFMWVTSPMLLENPGPREVIEAAGFEYKASMVWDKQLHNVGSYVSNRHEFLLICTKGSCTPDRLTPMIDSVVSVQRGEHSSKPEEFRKIIERLYDGPYLELFGRDQVEGWVVYGNDPALLGEKKQPKEKKPKAAKTKTTKADKPVGPKFPKPGKKGKKKKKGEVQDPNGEKVADIEDAPEPEMQTALHDASPDATVVTSPDDLTPEQIERIDKELAPIMQQPINNDNDPIEDPVAVDIDSEGNTSGPDAVNAPAHAGDTCKKHKGEPKPCQKCRTEKQARKNK